MTGAGNDVLGCARSLLVDEHAVEVAGALRSAGVRSILLKGASIWSWLYDDGLRAYGDVDLLIAPDDRDRAAAVLQRLAFEVDRSIDTSRTDPSAEVWTRGDGAIVDLHLALWGIGAPALLAWKVLSGRTVSMPLAGADIDVLDEPARLVLVGLHAAKHGCDEPKPIEDLRRALTLVDVRRWQEARELARALDATGPMFAALDQQPEGRALAARLTFAPEVALAVRLQAAGAPPLAVALARLRGAGGVRARLAWIAERVVLPADQLRAVSVLARRGPLGLALAQVSRPLAMLRQVPAARRALRVARGR